MIARIKVAITQSRKINDAQLNVGLLHHDKGDPVQKALPGAKTPTLAPSQSKCAGFLRLLNQIHLFQLKDAIYAFLNTNIVSVRSSFSTIVKPLVQYTSCNCLSGNRNSKLYPSEPVNEPHRTFPDESVQTLRIIPFAAFSSVTMTDK
jgi:hypothetical protein